MWADRYTSRPATVRRTSEPKTLLGYILRIPVVRGAFVSRFTCSLDCDAEAHDGDPIFVLVHGTWPKPKRGIHDSKLVKDLREKWRCSGLYRFKWSGFNGAHARLLASDKLAKRLNDLANSFPHSDVVLVSHSHGGNVAAWASTHIARQLAASVYLNTPFIQVLRQAKNSHIGLQIVLLDFVLAIIFFWGLLKLLALPFLARWERGGIVILWCIAFVLALILERAVTRRIEGVRDRLTDVSSGKRRIRKELVAYVIGDEVSASFGGVYSVQWFIGRLIPWLMVVAGLCGLGIYFALPEWLPKNTAGQKWFWVAVSVWLLLVCSLLLATVFHGLVQGLVTLDSSVTTTPSPIGLIDFATIKWTNRDKLRRDKLRHSQVYDSREAIEAIIDWLKRTVASLGS